MCGLVGMVSASGEAKARFRAALESISHRGPDGDGIFEEGPVTLGHRRLAIIDLSSAGDQPMRDPASGACIVFNGEIYNYLEIRSELQSMGVVFRSQTDTEVLLQAWLIWGEACFAKLNGMWAFAIWDPRSREVILARDRFGVKPLYWAVRSRQLLFASEPKALLALDPSLAEPSPRAMWRLFVDSVSHNGADTFFAHISSMPPAHFARVGIETLDVKPRRCWSYPAADGSQLGAVALQEEFSALFEDAARLRMRSDVPIGLTLSGGLDSSAILAAVHRQQESPLQCYTSVYGKQMGEGELPWARIAADATGAHLETVEAHRNDWLATLRRITWHMDSPGYSPAVFPLWTIMRRAREAGVPVLLEGQGADEVAGGYPQYTALAILHGGAEGSSRLQLLAGIRASTSTAWTLKWLARHAFVSSAERFGPRSQRLKMMLSEAPELTGTCEFPPGMTDPARRQIHKDHQSAILPALLHYGDAVSMAHGIESRLPFMDYRLVEWFYRRQPPLYQDGRSKAPIRDYLNRNRLQAIADRLDKKGYPTPVEQWVGEDARPLFEDWFANSSAPLWSFVDRHGARRLYDATIGGDYASAIHSYKLLTMGMWLDQVAQQRTAGRGLPGIERAEPA